MVLGAEKSSIEFFRHRHPVLLFLEERGAPNARSQMLHDAQGPGIEALQNGAVVQFVFANLIEHQLREALRIGCQFGFIGKYFCLHIELNRVSSPQREDFIESRNAGPGNGYLIREIGVLLASAVVLVKFSKCEGTDGDPGLRTGADGRVDQRIMGNDGDTIFCHRDVEFQHVYPLIERVLKCRESVLRPARTRAPMTVPRILRLSAVGSWVARRSEAVASAVRVNARRERQGRVMMISESGTIRS